MKTGVPQRFVKVMQKLAYVTAALLLLGVAHGAVNLYLEWRWYKTSRAPSRFQANLRIGWEISYALNRFREEHRVFPDVSRPLLPQLNRDDDMIKENLCDKNGFVIDCDGGRVSYKFSRVGSNFIPPREKQWGALAHQSDASSFRERDAGSEVTPADACMEDRRT